MANIKKHTRSRNQVRAGARSSLGSGLEAVHRLDSYLANLFANLSSLDSISVETKKKALEALVGVEWTADAGLSLLVDAFNRIQVKI